MLSRRLFLTWILGTAAATTVGVATEAAAQPSREPGRPSRPGPGRPGPSRPGRRPPPPRRRPERRPRPRSGFVWVPGRWVWSARRGRWVWRDGYWRRRRRW
ncbi:hypothetical protein [Microvirga sp. TS319]|uniref:hypothetical protein n=1 Tax=Microvirga sp. TS319 TaxID=3241165 RepID=UPI003519F37E